MRDISIDFETRSAVDLLNSPKGEGLSGVYNYASDPSTDVICMWYSVDGGEPIGWHPGEPVPPEFADAMCYAWNSTFERLIWEFIMVPEYGFAPIPLERWRCSAFMSRCSNLPNALGNAARCLNVAQQKSTRGRELIKLLCVPMADGSFCEDPDLIAEMDDYCAQDVRAEQAVFNQLRKPSEAEWEDFFANERINDRGVRIDREICDAAQAYAWEEHTELVARIEELTEGAVTKARGEGLKEWVAERLTPEQEQLLVKYRKGERKLSLDKYNRYRLLQLDDIDPIVREVVECSDFAQKSSVGKYRSLSRLADPDDDRVRGALMCNGAAQSGRYSSRGAQVHNFPRDCLSDPEAGKLDLVDNIEPEDIVEYWDMPIMAFLSNMLRPSLIPGPGKVFIGADWSAIEGRVAPWLCDTPLAERKLQLYRDDAPVYEITAAATFRVPVGDVDKDQRQVGKVQELSFQYGGGYKAFQALARNYGLNVTDAEAEKYKVAWRRNNPWAEHIWSDIERACMLAVKKPGELFKAGRLHYFTQEGILAGGKTLFCMLPCGRLLTYPDVRIEMKETPWGDVQPGLTMLRAAFVPKVGEKEWPRTGLYGGLLFENAVQGTAASLLRDAVIAAQYEDPHMPSLDVVMHVHDELVVECPDDEMQIQDNSLILHEVMHHVPAWAEGLPLKAEVEVTKRFGK